MITARSGVYKLIILALGAYGDQRLKALGIKKYMMEDYALLSILLRPEILGLSREDIEHIRGFSSREILEDLAERLGKRYDALLKEIFSKASRSGILVEVAEDVYSQLKRAIQSIKSKGK